VSKSWETLVEEHDRLLKANETLRLEHADIESRPVDLAEHERHRAKLRAHIDELHAHIAEWKSRNRQS
jgi:hypothetical protein